MVATLEAWLILSWSSILWHKQVSFFYWLQFKMEASKCLNVVSRPVISQQFNLMQVYSLKNMHYLWVCNYCMIILSSITRTILTLSSSPEPHLHNENGLQALNDLTNIMDPAFLLETLPKTVNPGTQMPRLLRYFPAQLFILSETSYGRSHFCSNSPTVLFWAIYTSQCVSPPWNRQVTAASPRYQGGAENSVKSNLAAGTGRYERPRGIWNGSQTAELRREKATIKKTRACSRGGSGWAAGSSRVNWGPSHTEGWCCLFMNVRLECILASVQHVTWWLCAPAQYK